MTPKPKIPEHELLRCIGRGSYGTVWLARSALGAYRAIKIVDRKAFRNQRAFEREFSGLQKYEPISREHEGFVDILHVGRSQKSGFFYYIMELADDESGGKSYRPKTLAGAKRLPVAECQKLGLSLSAALEQLHRRGLVHRDIKPSNIIFVKGVPKLADIGLVCEAGHSTFVGTDGYIPPEGPGTAQADLYGLGKVLYELATGKDRLEFPDLPTDLDEEFLQLNAIIIRACHNNSRQRYKTAADMHADLKRLGKAGVAGVQPDACTNLPAALTSFVGRQKDLMEIKRQLEQCRLLTLTGVGGCGKTRLAIEVGRQLIPEFADGVWLVELASVADPALVPKAVASALQIQEQRDRPLIALKDFLRDRQLLVLLDNCEHLIEACAELTETLLKESPGLRILATSREPLGITGEVHRFVSSLPRDEAVRLFAERARAVQAAFELTPVVTQICERLEGIPLAIELAAARVRALSVEQIAQRLTDRFRLLTGGSRTALARQQTLQATIHWSYNLLSEEEAALFRRLSVFAGGWTLEAAEVVCAGDLDVLTRLVDKSLVIAESGRYRMLETVRQFSQERLAESGGMEAVRDAHLRFYFAMAKRAQPDITAYAPKEWLELLERELDNLRSAMAWALETRPLEALRLAALAEDFWATRSRHSEGRQWLERGLAAAPEIPAADRALALEVAGRLAWYQADLDRALPALEESFELYRHLGNEIGMANVQRLRGNCYSELVVDHPKAVALYEQALALYRKAGLQWGIASVLNNLAGIAFEHSERDKARKLYEESIAIDREAGDPRSSIVPLNNLGDLLVAEGNFDRGRELLLLSLSLGKDLGNARAVAFNLESLAKLASALGQFERAAQLLGAAEALRKSHGLPLPQVDRADYDRCVAKVRGALTAEGFTAACERGRSMSADDAVAFALQPPR